MSGNPTCEMCGGNEYRLDSGFYFCAECNLQSQEFQEQVFDDYFKGARSTVVTLDTTRTGNRRVRRRETSWELLNYALKGLTDELIELGAPPSLKRTVLRLWVTYLNRLEVAFISRDEEVKARLGIGFKVKDANIIYGEPPKPPKRKRRRSWSESSFGSQRSQSRAITSSKRALAKAVYDHTSSRSDVTSDPEVGSLPPRNFKFTSEAKKVWTGRIIELASSSDDEAEPVTAKLKRKLKKVITRKRLTVENPTLTKLFGLIIFALKIKNVHFHMSDIVGWIEDGKLSVANCEKFVPEDVQVAQIFSKPTNLTTSLLRSLSLAKLLRIDPSNLSKDVMDGLSDLLRKYCYDLHLPADVHNIIWTLMSREVPKINIPAEFDYDACVVSFILISLKLLYGLDDVTERSIAPFTREGMLSWEEWTRRRVRLLACQAMRHHPTRARFYRNSYEGDPSDSLPLFANSRAMPGVFDKYFEEGVKRLLPHFTEEERSREKSDFDDNRQLDSYLDLEERLSGTNNVVAFKQLGGNFSYIRLFTREDRFEGVQSVKVDLVDSSTCRKSRKDIYSRCKLRRKNVTDNLRDVYLPGHQYWIIRSTLKRKKIRTFDGGLTIQERLPVSFYWLLNELSSIARQSSIALYSALVKYESHLFDSITPTDEI